MNEVEVNIEVEIQVETKVMKTQEPVQQFLVSWLSLFQTLTSIFNLDPDLLSSIRSFSE